ncbi:MAG: hypothetical protein ACPK7O_08745 [Methanobacterium sp.]
MVGELPADGQCSVCGGKVGIIQEEIEKDRGTPNSPQMYLETWKISKCIQCGHIESKELLISEKLT